MAIRKANANVGIEYLAYLEKELALLLIDTSHRPLIKQLHLGGGTPNFLTSSELRSLKNLIDRFCDIAPDAEVAIEVDPRTVVEDQIITLKAIGFNRISMGIQDFSEPVQAAINRHQSIELVTQLFQWIRAVGFPSINVDLIYGLPHQTIENFSETVDEIIRLSPERIALYSYAHVPWLKSHQSLIQVDALPSQDDKLGIFLEARRRFLNSGYDAIGMDHFAKSSDELALAYRDGVLHRNFMGYTVKPATEYLGIGVSSIGFISGHFVQSTKDLKRYYSDLDKGQLPLERGLELSQDDHIRQWVIQSLMCHFKLDKQELFSRYHVKFDHYFSDSIGHLNTCESQGLIEFTEQGILVTPLGRLFVRNVAMGFDAYLKQNSERRFSRTV